MYFDVIVLFVENLGGKYFRFKIKVVKYVLASGWNPCDPNWNVMF
jgi:hypothetical protein